MINVGVIGCGKIAQVRHIPEYFANPEVGFVAFYDRTLGRAMEMLGTYGGRVYETVEEMLAAPDIHAVSICTANFLHAEQAIAAMRAGKHVLCEKPMATSIEDAKEMVRVSQETGMKLILAHNQRITKTHLTARDIYRRGEIGELIGFESTFSHAGPETWSIRPGPETWFFDKAAASMGAIGDLVIHKIDLLLFMTGELPVSVMAKLTTQDKRLANGELIPVDDNAFALFTLSNGAVGTVLGSWTNYGNEVNSTILYGTKGVMSIYRYPDRSIHVSLSDGTIIEYDIDRIQTNVEQTKTGIIDLFIDSIQNRAIYDLSGESGLASMRAIFAAIESDRIGKAVDIG